MAAIEGLRVTNRHYRARNPVTDEDGEPYRRLSLAVIAAFVDTKIAQKQQCRSNTNSQMNDSVRNVASIK